jgi:enoyl-CoA hydratase/carnithine racemase
VAAFGVERRGAVAEVVLDRPEQRNALDAESIDELLGHLRALDADPAVGAVLLRGEGKGFCSGADLRELQAAGTLSAFGAHDGGQGWVDLMTTIPRMRLPVVAAPHGYALAGGCGLVAASDIVIAAAGTQFGVSEIRIGLFPIVVWPTVARAIGPRAARELALTGRRIDAEEAQRLGLVHHVAAPEHHLEEARALVADLASLGPEALRLGKFLMREVTDLPVEAGTAFAQSIRGAFLTTPDFAEGVAAFLEKRPARFRPG